MSKKGRLMGALEDLGLVEFKGEESALKTTTTPVPSPQAIPLPASTATSNSDPTMIAKIRAAVTDSSHSPRIASFLAQLEIARQAFPNDEKSAATAALAFSKLSAAEIREELSRSTAAALVEVEQGIRNDARNKRESAAGKLEQKSSQLQAEVTGLEKELASITQKLTTTRAELEGITIERSTIESSINEKEMEAMASLAAVKNELEKINTLLP